MMRRPPCMQGKTCQSRPSNSCENPGNRAHFSGAPWEAERVKVHRRKRAALLKSLGPVHRVVERAQQPFLSWPNVLVRAGKVRPLPT